MLKVKDGDLDKLGLLFERYKRVLFGFFYNMTHDSTLSEDHVQSVFMRILKYRKGFKGDGEFKVWMFHIARNVNIDHFRKNKPGRSEDIEPWKERIGESGSNYDVRIEKTEELELLAQAIKRLDAEQREVITLSKLEGMKYRDIGSILECTEGAVKVKVFRAMKELKTAYHGLQQQV